MERNEIEQKLNWNKIPAEQRNLMINNGKILEKEENDNREQRNERIQRFENLINTWMKLPPELRDKIFYECKCFPVNLLADGRSIRLGDGPRTEDGYAVLKRINETGCVIHVLPVPTNEENRKTWYNPKNVGRIINDDSLDVHQISKNNLCIEISERTEKVVKENIPWKKIQEILPKIIDLTRNNRKNTNYRLNLENKINGEPTMSTQNPLVTKLADLLKNTHNLILHGAPGTGKTHLAHEIAKAMKAETSFVQFHPSYDYTDFVEGLRPVKSSDGTSGIGFERCDGVFKEFCKKALKNPANNFLFIIDEINRGELSKIFGELFYTIESGYRGEKGRIQTQYQNLVEDGDVFKDGFFVPENVYIIGTMNDIDRSVDTMDFAFRRRFAFKEIKADDTIEMLNEKTDENGNKTGLSQEFASEAKTRMKNLNNAILEIEGLNSSYEIGASYFLKLNDFEGNSEQKFGQLWNYHLEGLLREYLRGRDDAEAKLDELKKAYDDAVVESVETTTKNDDNRHSELDSESSQEMLK